MTRYEIIDYSAEKSFSEPVATADDLIGLIGEALRLFREAGGKLDYKIPLYQSYILKPTGVVQCQCSKACYYLTLTPPRRETMEEWKKRRPEMPSATNNCLVMNRHIQALDQWLSEMPGGG